jgi:hypothetical protein
MQRRPTIIDRIKVGLSWFKKAHSFLGFIPAPVLAVLVGYLAYIAEVSPLVLVLAIINAFTCGIIIWKFVPAGRQRVQAAAVIIVLALIPVVVQTVQLRNKADKYELTLSEITASKELARLPDGSVGVRTLQLRIAVSNDSGIPIYYQVLSHDAHIEGHDSGVYDEAPEPVLTMDNNTFHWVEDDAIRFPPIPATQQLAGRVNFVIAYGRKKDHLDKRLTVIGPIVAVFYPDGRLFDIVWTPPPS